MLPERTTVLVVGAGPTGLAAAISLVKNGCRDVVVVDAVFREDHSSRATVIHAATLEALDTLSCADRLVELGMKGKRVNMAGRSSSPVFVTDFSNLASYTRFPYVLICPQPITEGFLEEQLNALGVEVHRPCKVIGISSSKGSDGLDVMFESGDTLNAKYVVGADGAHSAIRKLTGVRFADPDGREIVDDNVAQMVLADVTFTQNPVQPMDLGGTGIASPDGFFLIIPMPSSYGALHDIPSHESVYRIGFNIPVALGAPPIKPSAVYLQEHINSQGPHYLSSDPSNNPTPLRISKVVSSTHFRIRSAIADKFFFPIGGENGYGGGFVMLIGDAAHIHSPAGGQGMNLGIRDAVGLGAVLSEHVKASESGEPQGASSKILEVFASTRRTRALTTIKLTKSILGVIGFMTTPSPFNILHWVLKAVGKVPFVRNRAVWNMSGLGNR